VIVQIVGIVARQDNRGELGKALSSLLGPTQVERGCLSCLLYKAWSNPNVLYIESRWETAADLIQHIRSDNYKRLILLMELGDEAPTIEFLTVTEVKGRDFIKDVGLQQMPQPEDPKLSNLN